MDHYGGKHTYGRALIGLRTPGQPDRRSRSPTPWRRSRHSHRGEFAMRRLVDAYRSWRYGVAHARGVGGKCRATAYWAAEKSLRYLPRGSTGTCSPASIPTRPSA